MKLFDYLNIKHMIIKPFKKKKIVHEPTWSDHHEVMEDVDYCYQCKITGDELAEFSDGLHEVLETSESSRIEILCTECLCKFERQISGYIYNQMKKREQKERIKKIMNRKF